MLVGIWLMGLCIDVLMCRYTEAQCVDVSCVYDRLYADVLVG